MLLGETKQDDVELIPVRRIRPRKMPVRAEAGPEEIRRLAASIRRHGLLHPIVVRRAGLGYEVVCGQRRLLACRKAGLGEIPAVVRRLDNRQAFELSVAENARRGALTPDERRDLLRLWSQHFPGRPLGELEEWAGPLEGAVVETPAPAGADVPGVYDSRYGEPLPGWLAELPDMIPGKDDVSVVMSEDPPVLPGDRGADADVIIDSDTKRRPLIVRKSIVSRIRQLLNGLSRSGRLNINLLQDIVRELYQQLEETPAPDFLDLSYRGRSKRYVTRHCMNVAKLAMYLARSLGMSRAEIEEVATCGLLHDVGMMKVKADVFTKHAALDEEEWEQVKGHPTEGALLLTKEMVLRDVVARVALEHHERPDGSGYPGGKKKEEIHFYARLINVVDTYGAMVSPRAHRLPLLPHEAMKIVIDDGAKGMLDWDIIQAFMRALSMYPIGSYLRLENGEVARVVRASPDIPEKPVIAVVADAQRNILKTPVEIDLAMTEPLPKFEPIFAPI